MIETIVDVFDEWLDSRLDDIHTVLPGKIVEYYGHEKRKAKVKPLIKIKNVKGVVIQIEPIDDVPIIFPSTKKFNMLFPLKKDDGVLLLFSESSLGQFLSNNKEVDADSKSRFALTDCIAIPGLWSFNNCPDKPDNDDDFFLMFQDASISITDSDNDIVCKSKNGKVTMTLKGDGDIDVTSSTGTCNINCQNVNLGGDSSLTEEVIKGTQLETNMLTNIMTVFNTHTHTVPQSPTGVQTSAVPSSSMSTNPVTSAKSNFVKTS